MIKRSLIVIIILLLNIAIAISVDYPTHSTLYTNEIKPVSDPPIGSNITASTTVTINAAGKITRFNYNGDYLDVDLGKFIVKSDGKVGIGTASPGARLEVAGGDMILPYLNWLKLRASGGGAWNVLGTTDASTVGIRTIDNGATARVQMQTNDGTPIASFQNNGNVGIGTTTPGNKLHVVGTGGNIPVARITHTGDASVPGPALVVSNGYPAAGNGYEVFGVYGNIYTSSYLSVRDAGSVGIGTASPTQKLDVAGYVKGTGLCIGADCRTSWPAGGTSQWTTSGTAVYYNGGNVGIGIGAPYGALHVSGSQGASSWTYFGGNAGGAATPNADITTGLAMAWNPSNGEGENVIAYGIGAGVASRLDFASWNGATLSKVMTLKNINVGIGTSNPAVRLDVIGDVKALGEVIAHGFGFGQDRKTRITSYGIEFDVINYPDELGIQDSGGDVRFGNFQFNRQSNLNVNGKVKALNIGTTFTRWGRINCPTGTTLVYDGYVAGPHAGHGGSGKNTLCLSKSPTWLNYNDADNNGNLLYGTEFQTNNGGLSTTMGYLQDYEAQCAVCLEDDATMTLMVPGTYSCPSGWTTQYYGYLMATDYGQGGSETVCVDYTAQGFINNANNDQSQWYSTEAECGSLPCPPYVQNREVTCSVCTK